MRIGKFILACLIALAFSAAGAVAQDEDGGFGGGGSCGGIQDTSCPGGYHTVQFSGMSNNPHSNCMVCVSGGSSCHSICWGLAGAEVTKLFVAINPLNKRSVNDILKVAMNTPEFVEVNRSRMSLQVLSCDRSTVIANIPIPSGRTSAQLVAQLESAQNIRVALKDFLTNAALLY